MTYWPGVCCEAEDAMADSFGFQIDWTTVAIVIDRPGDVIVAEIVYGRRDRK
jgi:hypothetical protein